MNKALPRILAVLSSISLGLLSLYFVVHFNTFNIDTYIRHYEAYDTAQLIQVSNEDLLYVTYRLLDFLRGRDTLWTIYATVAGEYRQFFNEREIYHMYDVLLLFEWGRGIRNVSFIVFLVSLGYLIAKNKQQMILKYNFVGSLIWLGVIVLAGIPFLLDFDQAFIYFHHIFFFFDYYELWWLDPRTSLLINMVPINFWISIFTDVALHFVSNLLIIAFILCLPLMKILKSHRAKG